MSHESDCFSYFPNESTDIDVENEDRVFSKVFFTDFTPQRPQPPSQPEPVDLSPESFDKEIERLNLNWSFDQYDDFLSSFRDIVPAVFDPSALTYSTDSGYEFSQYAENIAPSVYSHSFEIATRGSEDDGLSAADNSIFSATFFNDLMGMSSGNLSAVQQSPTSAVPTALPVHVTLDLEEAKKAPAKQFKCPNCHFYSARKYNLKKHVDEKHNGLKPFGCDTCGHQFTRKHDLRRHRATVHGVWTSTSTSSVSTLSNRHFDPEPDVPRYHAGVNGDQRLTTSAYPDASSDLHPAAGATVVPEDIETWFEECAALHLSCKKWCDSV